MISELFAHPENWDVKNEKSGIVDDMRIITPSDLSELVEMLADKTINGKQAKEIFIKMLDGQSGTPREIADKFGMKQMTDTAAIEGIVDEVIAANPAQVEQYKSGKVGLLGFFVGNVMKKTGGTANPAVVNEILRNKLA